MAQQQYGQHSRQAGQQGFDRNDAGQDAQRNTQQRQNTQ